MLGDIVLCCLLLSDIVLCCLMLGDIVLCCLMLGDIVLCCLMLGDIVLCCLMLGDIVLCCLMLGDIVLCCLMLGDIVLCCLLLSDIVLCCLMLGDIVLCCLLLSDIVLCCLMLGDIVLCCLLQTSAVADTTAECGNLNTPTPLLMPRHPPVPSSLALAPSQLVSAVLPRHLTTSVYIIMVVRIHLPTIGFGIWGNYTLLCVCFLHREVRECREVETPCCGLRAHRHTPAAVRTCSDIETRTLIVF